MKPPLLKLAILCAIAISPMLNAVYAGTLEMRHVVSDRDQAEIVLPHLEEELFLSESVGITEADIASAKAEEGPHGWQIRVTLTENGAKRFSIVTKKSLKKRLAIIVNKKVLYAPVIQDVLTGGNFIIAGNFTKTEARRLANDLTGK